MTSPEVLVLWIWILASAAFFGWQLSALIGYWKGYGWPQTRRLRRLAARRRRREAEAALARWGEHHPEELQRLGNNVASIALLGMTSEEAIEAFASLSQELRKRA